VVRAFVQHRREVQMRRATVELQGEKRRSRRCVRENLVDVSELVALARAHLERRVGGHRDRREAGSDERDARFGGATWP